MPATVLAKKPTTAGAGGKRGGGRRSNTLPHQARGAALRESAGHAVSTALPSAAAASRPVSDRGIRAPGVSPSDGGDSSHAPTSVPSMKSQELSAPRTVARCKPVRRDRARSVGAAEQPHSVHSSRCTPKEAGGQCSSDLAGTAALRRQFLNVGYRIDTLNLAVRAADAATGNARLRRKVAPASSSCPCPCLLSALAPDNPRSGARQRTRRSRPCQCGGVVGCQDVGEYRSGIVHREDSTAAARAIQQARPWDESPSPGVAAIADAHPISLGTIGCRPRETRSPAEQLLCRSGTQAGCREPGDVSAVQSRLCTDMRWSHILRCDARASMIAASTEAASMDRLERSAPSLARGLRFDQKAQWAGGDDPGHRRRRKRRGALAYRACWRLSRRRREMPWRCSTKIISSATCSDSGKQRRAAGLPFRESNTLS